MVQLNLSDSWHQQWATFSILCSLLCEKGIHITRVQVQQHAESISPTFSTGLSISSNVDPLLLNSIIQTICVLHFLPKSTITESSRTCPVSLDPCWACTSHQPLCSSGNAARLTCWKQEVSPLTLRTRPVIQSRWELISLESDAGCLSLGFPTKLHLCLIKNLCTAEVETANVCHHSVKCMWT